jgi:hypothetical protein
MASNGTLKLTAYGHRGAFKAVAEIGCRATTRGQVSLSQAKVSAALHEKDRPPMPAALRGS